jgi:outer membrane protein
MNSTGRILVVAVGCVTLAFATLNAKAEVAGPRIVVINIQNAIAATDDGHKEIEALEKKFEPKKNDLKSRNDELEALKRQYEAQAPKLNEDARGALKGQINTKQRALSRLQEDVQADFNEQQSQIVQKILRKLGPVIDKYARERGVGLVIDNSKPWPEWPTVWAAASTDITKEVVDLYNAGMSVSTKP